MLWRRILPLVALLGIALALAAAAQARDPGSTSLTPEEPPALSLALPPRWDSSLPGNLPIAHQATNDLCQNATAVVMDGGIFSDRLITHDATTSANDPLQSCSLGGPAINARSVWWRITVPEDGRLVVNTATENPYRYDTVVSIYQADAVCGALGPAAELACNDDRAGFQSYATTMVDRGEAYLVEITGWGAASAGGELDILVLFAPDTHWQVPAGVGVPSPLNRHIAVSDGGYLFLLGGQTPGLSNDVYRYDPTTNGWSLRADMPSPYSNTDGAYVNGRIYVPSGYAGSTPYAGTHYVYDIASNTWSTRTPAPWGSKPIAWGAAATDPSGTAYYYTGGRTGARLPAPITQVELTRLTAGTVYRGETIQFSADLLPNSASKPYTYTIVFDDGTIPVVGTSRDDPLLFSHVFASTGTYVVEAGLQNADMASPISDTLQLVVSAPGTCIDVSEVDLGLESEGPLYTGTPILFSAQVLPANASIPYQFIAGFDDGTPSSAGSSEQNPIILSHNYAVSGTYVVGIAAWNCSMSSSSAPADILEITVLPKPVSCTELQSVDLSLITNGTLYPGSLVQFGADMLPDGASKPYTYTVDFGDGSATVTATSSLDPLFFSHAYAAVGTYTAQVRAWNCSMAQPVTDQLPVIISVPGACVQISQVELSTGNTVYTPTQVQLSADVGPNNASKPYHYSVDFGDGTAPLVSSSSDDPVHFSHTFAVTGNLTVTMGAWNCTMAAAITDTTPVDIWQRYPDVFRYDVLSDSWRTLPPMNQIRYAHQAAFVGDRLCVAGGIDERERPIADAECFDFASQAWSPIAPLGFPRFSFGSAVGADGRWYVFGGTTGTIEVTPKTEVYDPATDTWTLLSQSWSLNQAREWPRGARIGQRIYAAGGYRRNQGSIVSTLESLYVGSETHYLPLVTSEEHILTPDSHEPNDAIPLAYGPLTSGVTLQSTFGRSTDREDFFHITTDVSRTLDVRLSNIPAGSNYDLYLYGRNGNNWKYLFAQSTNLSNSDETLTAGPIPAGTYYIRVRNQSWASDLAYSVRVLVH